MMLRTFLPFLLHFFGNNNVRYLIIAVGILSTDTGEANSFGSIKVMIASEIKMFKMIYLSCVQAITSLLWFEEGRLGDWGQALRKLSKVKLWLQYSLRNWVRKDNLPTATCVFFSWKISPKAQRGFNENMWRVHMWSEICVNISCP
jgi:hypothetical protein